MGSSIAALTASLRKVAARLDRMLVGHTPDRVNMPLEDLEDDEMQLKPEVEEKAAIRECAGRLVER